MREPIELKQERLLVVEGADAKYFSIWATQGFGRHDIQVLDHEGVTDLTAYLQTLKLAPGFETIKSLVVVRDAETNAHSTAQSVQHSFQVVGLPVPGQPFQFTTGGTLKTAFALFPGPDDPIGTLEDLCLRTVADDPLCPLVDTYLSSVEECGMSLPRLHKSKLHAFLAGKDEYVGLKIGEAARAGAWNWQHPAFAAYREIVEAM